MTPLDGPHTAADDMPLFTPAAAPCTAGRRNRRNGLRDRFLRAGRYAVDDAELLQLLLSASHSAADAQSLAKTLLDTFGSPGRVLAAGTDRLRAIDGLGEAGVCAIKTAEALGIRLARGELPKRLDPALHNYDKAVEYCRTLTGHRPIEEFHVLFLDTANRLIRGECHQTGTINHAPAYPREICRRALELHSTAVLLSHNHPSGNVFPSNSDIEMTGRIQKALKTIDVTLHDHLIVTAHDALSFKARGLL